MNQEQIDRVAEAFAHLTEAMELIQKARTLVSAADPNGSDPNLRSATFDLADGHDGIGNAHDSLKEWLHRKERR